MQKILISFVIEAEDQYDEKVLEVVKYVKEKGGQVTTRVQPQTAANVLGIAPGTSAHAPTPAGKVPVNMRTGQPAPEARVG